VVVPVSLPALITVALFGHKSPR